MSAPRTRITDPAALRRIVGEPASIVARKDMDRLLPVHRAWLAASPFVVVATADAAGRCGASPKGDPAGVAYVVDDHTLALADRPGNRRVEGLLDILANPQVGLTFFVPGRGDTLRIDGRASVWSSAPYIDELTVRGHVPQLIIEVTVVRAFFHCGKSAVRSGLWDPETWRPQALPGAGAIMRELAAAEDLARPLPSDADRLY